MYETNKSNLDNVLKLIPYCDIDKDTYEKAIESIRDNDCEIAIAIMKNYKYKVDFPLNFEYAKNNIKFKEFLKENINKLDFSEGIRELLKLLMNYDIG